LDLVNADFSDDAEVDRILDTWEEKRPDAGSSHHRHKKGFDDEGQEGVTEMKRAPLRREIMIMFRRHSTLIIRDPILYIGRSLVFLIANLIFSLVYLQARDYTQDQALNKMWITVWHVGVASNMGVVAVYALNDEFKTIVRETKNGMVGPLTYALAKSVLVAPIMFIFAIFALLIPTFAVMDFPWGSFGMGIVIWAVVMYVFECLAECLSIWVDDPILGMLNFMNFWFGAFLFGGWLIAEDDIVWPFRVFYFIMPYSYYIRSQMYNLLHDTEWAPCEPDPDNPSAICVPAPAGQTVPGGIILEEIHRVRKTWSSDTLTREPRQLLINLSLSLFLFYRCTPLLTIKTPSLGISVL
jgi:hypothetical protein